MEYIYIEYICIYAQTLILFKYVYSKDQKMVSR